nr:hypothetical protein [uncultured Acetatifactor sp.]
MMGKRMTFALAFCNRGFMPGELIYGAREDMIKAVTDAGYDYIAMDAELTRFGGIETRDEGLLYAKWLKEHEGQYDGVIFSMPIFADENGAITALQDAGVPILMQAYPDEIGKMDFAHRRDAFCGKFSVTDVFTQYQVPFTVMKPHVVHPLSEAFKQNLRDFAAVPEEKKNTLAKISVVIDEYIESYHLDAIALRCWNEMEEILRVCPCVLLSELNDRGITASCEIDMCSAITMRAMSLASETPATVLDWNNNYGEDENKVILFHCGPVPKSLMTDKGKVTSHKMFDKNDPGSGCGTCEGRIRPGKVTLSNCQTKDGKIIVYASEAAFTDDPVEEAFFGCGGVCEISDMQDKMIRLARGGFKHHTSVGAGHMKEILKEAFTTYLGYVWVDIDN